MGLCKPHYQREWFQQNRDRAHAGSRKHYLKERYGITPDEYDAMLASQSGGCATCGAPESAGRRRYLWVDHDHATGAVRGLLCPRCNTVAGLLGDDTMLAQRIIDYLTSAHE